MATLKKQSAGILLFRFEKKQLQVFLVHPGGPFWKNKEAGAWSIPKGEYDGQEVPLNAAIREFREETGFEPGGDFISLQPVKQKSGKIINAWAVAGQIDPAKIISNEFEMEWPPRSGKKVFFPEVDKAGWFIIDEARKAIIPGQVPLLDELEKLVGV